MQINASDQSIIFPSGSVGIGTTSPAGKLHIVQNNDVGRYSYFGSNSGLFIKANDNSINSLLVLENTQPAVNYGVSINFNLGYGGDQGTAGTAIQGSKIVAAQEQTWTSTAGTQDAFLAFYTALNGTSGEKMRIDSNGNLLVARTDAGLTNATGVTIGQSSIGMQTEGNAVQIVMNRTTSDGTIVEIRRNNVAVGTISVTTTATAYNTTSDYRLKESVKPLFSGLDRVNALKPSVYTWKSDGSNGEGFLAHELAEVVPIAVTGEKDAVNKDGSINPQGVDMSKVVPILVAAIQELSAKVKTLEAKVQILESK